MASFLGIGTAIVLSWQPAQEQFLKVWDRAQDGMEDSSLLVRRGAMSAGWEMFKVNPLFGAGVIINPEEFRQFLPMDSIDVEVSQGTGSVGVGILAGQGMVGFFCYCALIFLALKRSRQDPELHGALIGILVTMNIQVGYETIYALWVILGMSLSFTGAEKAAAVRKSERAPFFRAEDARPLGG